MNLAASEMSEVEDQGAIYAKTDVTALVDIIQSIVLDNKKSVDELAKLHRQMYQGIIQKQNDELENYRRGALRQSMVHVLRSVAEIYNENNQDFDLVENPIALLKYIMSQLKEILQDNDVQFVQSDPETPFSRKFMKTQERLTVQTAVPDNDRVVVKSIKPGYTFFGEPLLQELVSVWKYTQNADTVADSDTNANPSDATSCESDIEHDEANAIFNSASSENKHLNESEDVNHA